MQNELTEYRSGKRI